MEIDINTGLPECPFSDLLYGDVFLKSGGVYIRICSPYQWQDGENAIKLSTGDAVAFDGDEKVTPTEAKLFIKAKGYEEE